MSDRPSTHLPTERKVVEPTERKVVKPAETKVRPSTILYNPHRTNTGGKWNPAGE